MAADYATFSYNFPGDMLRFHVIPYLYSSAASDMILAKVKYNLFM